MSKYVMRWRRFNTDEDETFRWRDWWSQNHQNRFRPEILQTRMSSDQSQLRPEPSEPAQTWTTSDQNQLRPEPVLTVKRSSLAA